MLRALRFAVGSLLLMAAAVFAYAFYDRYWRWRDCFNELGRCWDSDSQQVYLEQAGIIWGGGTVVFSMAALAVLWGTWRPRRDRRSGHRH